VPYVRHLSRKKGLGSSDHMSEFFLSLPLFFTLLVEFFPYDALPITQ
jgi:hypothetical protein